MGGNPVFRGTRGPVHMLAELVPSRACARTRAGGEVLGPVLAVFALALGADGSLLVPSRTPQHNDGYPIP